MADNVEQLRQAILNIRRLQHELSQRKTKQVAPIAIIGMACRLPNNISTLEQYWNLLINGQTTITEIPASRFDIDKYYDDTPNTPGKFNTRFGSFLQNIEQFDNELFEVSIEELNNMDFQQRVLLDVTLQALQHANISKDALAESNTGVFIGMGSEKCDFLTRQALKPKELNAFSGVGNTMSSTAGRISYLLNINGPNIAVDTACSSSLVALHFACESLRHAMCDQALVGAVSLILSPVVHIICAKMGLLSPDGYCRGFDKDANGFGRGEGCGVVVLKRLEDAVKNNDNILAIIHGNAINHNGLSNGITAPSQLAQEGVMQNALASGQLSSVDINFIEAHATGSPLGDALEFAAIQSIYGKMRDNSNPCFIGSAKSNFGHLEAAAGIASLIKVVLALQNKIIPKHALFNQLHPYIEHTNKSLVIPTTTHNWPNNLKQRMAAISSFGWSGQNAHIIVGSP